MSGYITVNILAISSDLDDGEPFESSRQTAAFKMEVHSCHGYKLRMWSTV